MDQRRQGATRGRRVAWGQMYSAGQHSREKVCVRQRIALRRFGTVLLTSIDTSRPPGYAVRAIHDRKWQLASGAVRARARRRSFAHDRSRHASGPARRERPREARGVRPGGRGRAHAPTPSAATRRPLRRCAGSAGAVPWRRGSIMRGCWSACLWDRGASGRRTVRSTTGRVTTCSIA